MSRDATSTLLAFLGLGLVWGATFPITKLVLPYVGPTQIVLIRVVSGFVPLLCYCMITGQMRRAHWRLWPHFLAMSFLATTLYYIAYAWAATEMLSGVASVLSGTAPLLVFLFSAMFLPHERLNWRKAIGVMIGFAGVVLVANPSVSAVSQTSVAGLLFLLLGAISLSLSFIYARKFLAQHDIPAAALVTYQLGIASLFLLALTPKQGIEQILLHPWPGIALIVGLGVLGTGLAYLLYYLIVQRLGAVAASSSTYLPPLVGLAISVALMGEDISWTSYAAMVCILSGVWLLRDTKPQPKERNAE